MNLKRIFRHGLDPQSSAYLNQIVCHPLESGYRLIRRLSRDDENDRRELLQNLAMGLPDRVAGKYAEELSFLESFPREDYPLFPYPRVRDSVAVEVSHDASLGMSYVLHSGLRLYFPSDVSDAELERTYRYFVEDEGLLGTGCRAKSPHAYTDTAFHVDENDVIVDIGCSDGLFSLDNARVAKGLCLIESWSRWKSALEATFAPFKEKTQIIDKFVSDKTNGCEIRLEDAVAKFESASYFIKMDIEGGERVVLGASRDFLANNPVRLSCSVYHRQDDAEWIGAFLEELGFKTRFSEGYMLPLMNGIKYPYFRRGVVYAWKE